MPYGFTTTVAVMAGWMEQWYVNVPAVEKDLRNVAVGAKVPLFQAGLAPSAVDV